MTMALLDTRVTGLVVCRSSTHMRILEAWLQSEVSTCVLDPHNGRYHNADLVRKFQVPDQGVQAARAEGAGASDGSVDVEQTLGSTAAAADDASASSSSSEEEEEEDAKTEA